MNNEEDLFMAVISAVNRTIVLLSAMLTIVVAWGFFRIPDANILILTFTFLTAAFVVDIPSFRGRLEMAVRLACFGSTAQFFVAMLFDHPLLQVVVSTIFSGIVFRSLPDIRSSCIVLIVGYLAFSAPPGFQPAAGRVIDIFCGVPVIMTVTTLCRLDDTRAEIKYIPCSQRRSLILAAELGAGNLICQMFHLKQGAWIMLTILFVTMAETPENSGRELAIQRIFAVPAGIITGGFLLDIFCRTDHRLVYLIPVIGAAGFFFLYKYGNFFVFSLIFMITLTIFSDWMTGPYHRFHFLDILFSRSAASLLGAVLAIIFSMAEFSAGREKV